MPLLLPPNPSKIRILDTPETERLRALYPDLPQRPRDCKTCRGHGTFLWKDDGWGDPVEYFCGSDLDEPSCVEQFQLHRYLLHAGIDLNYQRLAWADAGGVERSVLDQLFAYLDESDSMISNGIGLTLTGASGTGKTMLSSLLLKRLVANGHKGFFTTFHTLLDYFTAGWTSTDEKRWFDGRVRNAGVLVIDDMGREHKGRIDVAISTLDHVLRARVASARPTILTSNLDLPKLGDLYSPNALSLLSESSITISFTGADYRPTHQQNKIAEARLGLTRPLVVG